MFRRTVSGVMLSLLLIGMFSLTVNIKPVKGTWTGTVYIRADGSIDPLDAPIITFDNVTYTLTENITCAGIVYPYTAIVVERDNVIIDGADFIIKGSDVLGSKGIDISGRRNVTVKNANIEDYFYGIYLSESYECSILGNSMLSNFHVGIYIQNSSTINVFLNNIVSTNDYGIDIDGLSSNNAIFGNVIANNRWGIALEGSYNIISENNITNNSYGITCAAVVYPYTSIPKYNKLSYNNVKNNFEGIWLSDTLDSTLIENTITNNSIGIELDESSGNWFYGNVITNNDKGVFLRDSSNNNFSRNIIEANQIGIYLDDSNNNIIHGNNIANNSNKGVWLSSAYNNMFYHNNFMNNSLLLQRFTNIWDNGYPSGGNYWSSYKGFDYYAGPYQNITGSDGIGDTPYVIDENNVDHYPLMGPFMSFNTSVGYSVDVVSNSTVKDFRYFDYNSTIVLQVSNMTSSQTTGFCRLTIPHNVIAPPYSVKVNGTLIDYQTIYENQTEGISIIYFTYQHSKLEIVIVPEFPSKTILLGILMLITIPLILAKKNASKKANSKPTLPFFHRLLVG